MENPLLANKFQKIPQPDPKITRPYNRIHRSNSNDNMDVKDDVEPDFLVYKPKKRCRTTNRHNDNYSFDNLLQSSADIIESQKNYEDSIDKVVYSWYESTVLVSYEPVMRCIINCSKKLDYKNGVIRCQKCNEDVNNTSNITPCSTKIVIEYKRTRKVDDSRRHVPIKCDKYGLVLYNPKFLDYLDNRQSKFSNTDYINLYHFNGNMNNHKGLKPYIEQELINSNNDDGGLDIDVELEYPSPLHSNISHSSLVPSDYNLKSYRPLMNVRYLMNYCKIWDPYISDEPINPMDYTEINLLLESLLLNNNNNDYNELKLILNNFTPWFNNISPTKLLGNEGLKRILEYPYIHIIIYNIEYIFKKIFSYLMICKALQSSSINVLTKYNNIKLTHQQKLSLIYDNNIYNKLINIKNKHHNQQLPKPHELLCSPIIKKSPKIINEYINYGGTPITTIDTELGTWCNMSPLSSCTLYDIPIIYLQQVQYTTKKYLSLIDDNEILTYSRNINSNFSNLLHDIKLNNDDNIKNNMKYQHKGEARSKYKFANPYANVDIQLDKDISNKIKLILNQLHTHNKNDTLITSTNGYYYHENGVLVEDEHLQNLRNLLFKIERSLVRTAYLTEIINDCKRLYNTCKPIFLSKCKQVIVGKSKIHGYGLFAGEHISKGELILEYSGLIINDYIADIWESKYQKTLGGSTYLFRLDRNYIIDSTRYGNSGRFINHSCTPNTVTTNFSCIEDDDFGTHVGVYASKDIVPGEELFYNYRLSDSSSTKEACYCGSESCKGYMSIIK